MSTGSDTRMYSPRSESMLGYTKDEDDYTYGIGDPEAMEAAKDKRIAEKDAETQASDLPHLTIEVPKPEPEMPPMMPGMEEEEEEDPMADQYQEGNQLSAMTGMPDTGNLSIGNATGTMPAPGGMLATGEPMEDAWSSLMKEDDNEEEEDDEVPDKKFSRRPPPIDLDAETNRLRRLAAEPVIEMRESEQRRGMIRRNAHGDPDYFTTGEPIDDAWSSLMKNRVDQSPTIYQRPPVQTANPLPPQCPTCQGKILSQPCPDCGAPASPLAGTAHDNTVSTGEPIDDAWSSLIKSRLDKVGGKELKPWTQPQFRIQPGGANISTATSRRSKLHSRYLQPSKKHGLMRSPLSVHMTHLGVATKQPLKLFPEKYRHQMGTMARRKLMGNIPQPMSGHGLSSERTYNPKPPKISTGEGLSIRAPTAPKLMGQSLAKSDDLTKVKKQLDEVSKKMDYMHFAQMRRLLRRMKESMENRDRHNKAAVSAGPGQNREAGHREGQDSTTRNEGATEDMENDPKNWGAPSTMFAARGSGRVG